MKKPKTPHVPDNADDKEQSKLFLETAREHETDDTEETFERAFKKLTAAKPLNRRQYKDSGR